MLTLYYKPTCAFCRRVTAVIDRLGINVEMKDVTEDAVMEELVAIGGKQQTPFLASADGSVNMYESDDIVEYLQANYGKSAATPVRPRIHISESACVSCEG